MKTLSRLMISIVVIIINTQSFSQNYYPFPDSSAIWNTVGENIFSSNEFRIRYGIYGDTTINSQTYHKIYDLFDTNLIHQNSTYFAALRNENKKVIIIIPGYPETVLYDFLLSEGDTIWYEVGGCAYPGGIVLSLETHYQIVVSIDSALLENGEYRKRWNLDNGFMGDTWIEGVGSINWFGLFNPLINDILLCGDNFYFACLKQNEGVVFLNNPQCEKCFCQLYTATYQHEIKEKNALIIFPNPAIDKITIRFNESGLSANRLIIYNSMGMKISERTINKYPEIEILVDKFNSGLHTIQIFNKDNKILGIKKFIIE